MLTLVCCFFLSLLHTQEHRLGRWDVIKAGRNGARVYALEPEALLEQQDADAQEAAAKSAEA